MTVRSKFTILWNNAAYGPLKNRLNYTASSSFVWAEGRDRGYFVSRRSNISKLIESLDKFVLSQSRRL